MQLVFVAFDGYFLRSSMLLSMPTPNQLLVDFAQRTFVGIVASPAPGTD